MEITKNNFKEVLNNLFHPDNNFSDEEVENVMVSIIDLLRQDEIAAVFLKSEINDLPASGEIFSYYHEYLEKEVKKDIKNDGWMYYKNGENIDINGNVYTIEIVKDTDKAYLVNIGGFDHWFPKSQVEYIGQTIKIKNWLAKKNFLPYVLQRKES